MSCNDSLQTTTDDGIVVESREGQMCTRARFLKSYPNDWVRKRRPTVAGLIEKAERDMTDAVVARSADRFERRLVEEFSKLQAGLAHLRVDMLQGDAALRTEIQAVRSDLRDQKAELLKWSFLFWAGQLAGIAALFRLTAR